jgi:sigma-B regulation protein RsbU (phosphoserine phosphatase)
VNPAFYSNNTTIQKRPISQNHKRTCLLKTVNSFQNFYNEENGLMLGPFPSATYETTKRNLTMGDRLVIYTNGITEAVNSDDEEFGIERLQQFLAQNTEMTTEEFADNLIEEVADWTGHKPGDDLTLIVIDLTTNPVTDQ